MRALAAVAVLGALGGAAVLGHRAGRPPAAVSAGWAVPDFALKDDRGRTVRRQDLLGRPWVAAFIYASCGTQCPMMTAKMVALRKRLPQAFLVSFSVDDADTPERLAGYKKAYGADWMFLTGGKGEVQRLCKEGFRLPVALGADPKDPVIHSDRLALVDRAGAVTGFYDPADAGQLASLEKALTALSAPREP